jgi:GTP-binding protein
MEAVSKAKPKKSSQKPRSLKQRQGPSHNRRHGKSIRAEEAAKRKRRMPRRQGGVTAAAQKHPPVKGAAVAPEPVKPRRSRVINFGDDVSGPEFDATYDRAFGNGNSAIHADPAAVDHAALPLVAICGRPNVGKSTLFNRLTGTRRSIVGDEPGITRDRIYGTVDWAGREIRLVDTGGIVPDDEALIPSEIFRQARVALEEAAAIILMVDGRTELASPDLELARLLIRTGKPLFLAVNKMDTPAFEATAQGFHSLGIRKLFPISSEHGIGIGDLLDAVFEAVPAPVVIEPAEYATEPVTEEVGVSEDGAEQPHKLRSHGEFEARETKIAIIGRPNVGKSTLLNALTGTDRAIMSPIAGTTRDAVDELVTHDNHDYRFIDTAGIRRKGKTHLMAEKLSVVMARKHLEAADLAILIVDATEGVTALDATIGGYAHESGRSVIICVNKWDLVGPGRKDGKPPADIAAYEQRLRRELKFLDYAPVLFLSALDALSEPGKPGNPRAITRLFKEITMVARERRKRVSTGQMNRFLAKVDFQRASVPMSRRMRIFYMTQAAVAPPTFILFTDRDVKLHFAFERFLENQLRQAFGFTGSPIWFKIRARNKKQEE